MDRIKDCNNPESRTPSKFDHTKRIGRFMGIDKDTGDVSILVDDTFLEEAYRILNNK